jgi:hypothetical protein
VRESSAYIYGGCAVRLICLALLCDDKLALTITTYCTVEYNRAGALSHKCLEIDAAKIIN